MTEKDYLYAVEQLEAVDIYIPEQQVSVMDYEDEFRELIEHRIEHCEYNLKTNIQHAKSTMQGQIIVWPGGHFSWPVYKALIESREQHPFEWSALVWEQIIRQMARESCRNVLMYDMASEGCLCGKRY